MEACAVHISRAPDPRFSESADADRAAKRVRVDEFSAWHREQRQLVHGPAATYAPSRLYPRQCDARGGKALDRACRQDVRDHADAQSQVLVHRLQLQRRRPRGRNGALLPLQRRHAEIRRDRQRSRCDRLSGDRVQLASQHRRTNGGCSRAGVDFCSHCRRGVRQMGWDRCKRAFEWGAGAWVSGTIVLQILRMSGLGDSARLLIDNLDNLLGVLSILVLLLGAVLLGRWIWLKTAGLVTSGGTSSAQSSDAALEPQAMAHPQQPGESDSDTG